MRRGTLLLCGLGWLAALAAPAAARQAAAPVGGASKAPAPTDLRAQQNLVQERNRVAMHADPVAVAGLEQGANDIRSRTPALSHPDRAAALVDTDELYQRTLAMYEDGAVFHKALTPISSPAAPRLDAPSRATVHPPITGAGDARSTTWFFGLAIAAVLVLWYSRRASVPMARGGERGVRRA